MKRFVIIDGNSLLHRAWHALPPLTTKSGEVTNAVYGFTMILVRVLKELQPNYLAVAFDTKGPTFRHQEYKEYKAQRKKQPADFYQQFSRVKEILNNFDISYLEAPGFEADDIIATLATDTQNYVKKNLDSSEKIKNIIISGDLDLLQLIDNDTEVHTLKKGITEVAVYDQKAVQERYGLKPEQMIDYKALRGDPSDNIPGVRGIGEKTALDLIEKFGSLEKLYQKFEQSDLREKTKTLLKEQKENAFFSKKLVTVKRDVPLEANFNQLEIKPALKEKIVQLFKELEFHSLLPRVLNFLDQQKNSITDQTNDQTKNEKQKATDKKYILIDNQEKFEKFLSQLKKQKEFAFDTETTGLDPFSANLLGISFSWQANNAYYLNFNQTNLNQKELNKLKTIFEDPQIKKIGHHIKYDFEVLEKIGFDLQGISFDTIIAAYLLDPGKRTYGLNLLAFNEFGVQMTKLEELIGKGAKQLPIETIPHQKLSDYSCADADYTWQLKERYEKKLNEDKKIKWIFEKVEMPLIRVLAKMEKAGLKINITFLKDLSKEAKRDLEILETRIFESAGQEFNVNSPKQLKEILFEKLKIPVKGLGKTKTGVSTAAAELEKLKNLHPIILLISEHRELSKLYSTYLEALPKLVNPKTDRLHTSFNQTITATGRLSSSEPNLQNIPIRTTLGKKIREAFIVEKKHSLVSADYSQIELRIIASLANDKKMIGFFNEGKDVHLMTAAEIREISSEKVTAEMRRLAKTVNFGIIYGLGKNGLARNANISREKAKQFIEKYFEVYPQIKKYIEKLKKQAEKNGYAETLFGRKRYLPEINSNIQMLRAEAERMAVNMPIQGLAADLIKIAMIELDKRFEKLGDKVKSICQIHDELLFEVENEKIEETIKIIKEVMEKPPIEFRVPIKVDVRVGKNWGKLKIL